MISVRFEESEGDESVIGDESDVEGDESEGDASCRIFLAVSEVMLVAISKIS